MYKGRSNSFSELYKSIPTIQKSKYKYGIRLKYIKKTQHQQRKETDACAYWLLPSLKV